MSEVGINFCDTDGVAFVSSDTRTWVNRIHKLAQLYPEAVLIQHDDANNGGYVSATMPKSWIRIGPPRVSNMTTEQRKAASERMRAYHEGQC